MSSAGSASPQEQRILAAVVFTDVVGFSRLAANNESRAYQALQRDFSVMTNLCRVHNGQVLNTMGDGMLMSFSSAVDAMSCAVEIQRTIANQAKSLPLADVLHHRIGVHLGDIIVNGDNVFGDGVNTASRLQTHARPDSIWFSDTVQQVVKGKLKFESKYIGPRTFKNLGHTVSVWEVPPVAELVAQQQAAASGVNPNLIIDTPETQGARGGKAAILMVASLVLVGLVVIGIFAMKANYKEPVARPRIGKVVTTEEPTRTDAPDTTTPEVPPKTTPTEPKKLSVEDATTKFNTLHDAYDFEGIKTLLSGVGSEYPNSATVMDTYSSLIEMKAWILSSLSATTSADPVKVDSTSYFANGGQLKFDQNGTGFQDFTLESLPPKQFDDLAKAIQAKQGSAAPLNSGTWLQSFAQEYKL